MAWGSFLAFTALLPVQVSLRVPFAGEARVAAWPADLALGVALLAYVSALVRGVRRVFGSGK